MDLISWNVSQKKPWFKGNCKAFAELSDEIRDLSVRIWSVVCGKQGIPLYFSAMIAPFKYIYLLLGVVMVLGSIYSFYKISRQDSEEAERLLGRREFGQFLILLAFILGVILLRIAYVMFMGLSRSVVF
ncbi:hypothetical protein HOF92_00135 [bacterium]|nr:hypothetical protein [bacterium]